MAYENNDGCGGCVNLLLFVLFAFFIIVLFFKGCVSCADEAYRSYNKWRQNNSVQKPETNIYIPSQQDAYQQRNEYIHQNSSMTNERKVVSYYAICPVCNGSGRPTCSTCNGSRWVRRRCFNCNGTGKSSYLTTDGEKLVPVPCACNECSGTGWKETICPNCSPLDQCNRCNGRGRIIVTK